MSTHMSVPMMLGNKGNDQRRMSVAARGDLVVDAPEPLGPLFRRMPVEEPEDGQPASVSRHAHQSGKDMGAKARIRRVGVKDHRGCHSAIRRQELGKVLLKKPPLQSWSFLQRRSVH